MTQPNSSNYPNIFAIDRNSLYEVTVDREHALSEDGLFMGPLKDWLTSNISDQGDLWYSTTSYNGELYFYFLHPDHAVLFKMTWAGQNASHL